MGRGDGLGLLLRGRLVEGGHERVALLGLLLAVELLLLGAVAGRCVGHDREDCRSVRADYGGGDQVADGRTVPVDHGLELDGELRLRVGRHLGLYNEKKKG